MPVFNVTLVQRVTKIIDTAGNEKVVVDRVIAHKESVIALDNLGAAAIGGSLLPKDYDIELLGQVMVKVQATVA